MPATPCSNAATVCASVSRPSALAKWFSVPAGKTASGKPRSCAICATLATVPSPPATPSATGSPSIRSARSVSGSHSSTLACGSDLADRVGRAVAGAGLLVHDDGEALAAGQARCRTGGHQRRTPGFDRPQLLPDEGHGQADRGAGPDIGPEVHTDMHSGVGNGGRQRDQHNAGRREFHRRAGREGGRRGGVPAGEGRRPGQMPDPPGNGGALRVGPAPADQRLDHGVGDETRGAQRGDSADRRPPGPFARTAGRPPRCPSTAGRGRRTWSAAAGHDRPAGPSVRRRERSRYRVAHQSRALDEQYGAAGQLAVRRGGG